MLRALLLTVTVLLLNLSTPTYAFNPFKAACDSSVGNGAGANSAACNQSKDQIKQKTNPVFKVSHEAVNIVASIAAVVAVVTIIYAGLRLIISGDNPEQVSNARGIIINTIVGLAIISAAWLIITITLKVLQ